MVARWGVRTQEKREWSPQVGRGGGEGQEMG